MKEENKRKKNILYTIIALSVLIIAVSGVTYAYFAVGFTNKTDTKTTVTAVKASDLFKATSDEAITLDVTNKNMAANDGTDDYTSFTSDSENLDVSLTAGSGTATCTYDLAIVSEKDTYTKTSGLGDLLEYTVQGKDTGKQKFAEINVDDAMNSTMTAGESDESGEQVTSGILGHYTISDTYDDGETQNATTQKWTITSKFYNLTHDQKEQLGKTYIHIVKVVNVKCTNSNEIKASTPKAQLVAGSDYSVGNEVAIGDEHFYIISSDDTSVTMLAKYNLLVGYKNGRNESEGTYSSSDEGYGLQSENAKGWVSGASEYIGTVAFSSTYYWSNVIDLLPKYGSSYPAYVYDDNTPIKSYVDNYKTLLEDNCDINISEARLIKAEELKNLGCNDVGHTCNTSEINSNNRQWIYSTTYWTGSSADAFKIWQVYSNGNFYYLYSYDYEGFYGIRPVITIPKSEF